MTPQEKIDHWLRLVFWCAKCFTEKANGGICEYHQDERQRLRQDLDLLEENETQ